jgi:hypothetical protein
MKKITLSFHPQCHDIFCPIPLTEDLSDNNPELEHIFGKLLQVSNKLMIHQETPTVLVMQASANSTPITSNVPPMQQQKTCQIFCCRASSSPASNNIW